MVNPNRLRKLEAKTPKTARSLLSCHQCCVLSPSLSFAVDAAVDVSAVLSFLLRCLRSEGSMVIIRLLADIEAIVAFWRRREYLLCSLARVKPKPLTLWDAKSRKTVVVTIADAAIVLIFLCATKVAAARRSQQGLAAR